MSRRFPKIEFEAGARPLHVLAYLYAVLISSGYAGAMAVLGFLIIRGLAFQNGLIESPAQRP